MHQILDGKQLSQTIKDEIKERVSSFPSNQRKPHLAAVLVGEDGASKTYVGHKVKSCEYVGFTSTIIRQSADIQQDELFKIIDDLNQDDGIDGFIVQLPVPKHLNSDAILERIDPKKDVDGFHPENMGRLALGLDTFISATPFGILELLSRYNIETSGKHCVVVGRSNIVGRPMSILMSRSGNPGNCTVTLTHSRTKDLRAETLRADILIVAIGNPEFLTGDMVKEGAVVIDVGISRVDDASKKRGYALKGDVKFDEVAPKCSYITPVPGGVGPLTVVSLLKNTLKAYERNMS